MVISRTLYNGIPTQQCENFHLVFEKFFNNEKFDHVIEIGTAYGGMALFLYEQSLKHNFIFETYDIINHLMVKAYKNSNKHIKFTYHKQDCFRSNIIHILRTKKCLLLCDGGNKIKEIKHFTKHIQTNSYIMAHDYARNKEYFKDNLNNKIWNWHEISDYNIEEVLNTYNVIKSEWYEEFSNVAWLSCVKK